MKKLSLLLILLTLSLIGISQPKFGFKGGLNIANGSAENSGSSGSQTADSKLGIFGGISLDIPLNEQLFFVTGAQFVMRGYEESFTIYSTKVTATASLNYIDIPLMLKYRIKPIEEGNSLFLTAGGKAGFNMSANVEASANGESDSQSIKDDVESFHFALAFGGGFEIESGNVTIIPEATYNLGLTKVNKSGTGELTLSDIMLGIGIRF